MLPSTFSPTGNYKDRELDRARGYRLLVHAEIESYLEDISKDTVTKAISKWKNNKTPSSLLIAFLASYHSSWSVNNEMTKNEIIDIAKSRNNIKDSVEEVINLAQTQFIKRVKANNGIKEKNFKTLILPIGIDLCDLDATWITNLDNFGGLRGEVAHNTKRATSQINPQDEYILVKSLLAGLEQLDRKISSIQRQFA
ncbi:MAG: HEPN domain-containing protein [Methylococcales bacterium]|nr:HEPN domain-containing protein [Methylococcales bacterium]